MPVASADLATFIARNLVLEPVPLVPEIRLYRAHPRSGLRTAGIPTPYWAYPWAGGVVLARYILDNPAVVAGRRVLDLGAGGGLVAIAAAKAGAASVSAAESDRFGLAAIALNAAVNGVSVATHDTAPSLTGLPLADVDLVLAGDVFYAPAVARRMSSFLARCRTAGIDVLVGDPDRRDLPRSELCEIARLMVPDVGGAVGETVPAAVYAFTG